MLNIILDNIDGPQLMAVWHDFSSLWWCESKINSVETILWILNLVFSWTSYMQSDTLLCWTAVPPQLSVIHEIMSMNHSYAYSHSVPHNRSVVQNSTW